MAAAANKVTDELQIIKYLSWFYCFYWQFQLKINEFWSMFINVGSMTSWVKQPADFLKWEQLFLNLLRPLDWIFSNRLETLKMQNNKETLKICTELFKTNIHKLKATWCSGVLIPCFCDADCGVCANGVRQEHGEGAVHQETGQPPFHHRAEGGCGAHAQLAQGLPDRR